MAHLSDVRQEVARLVGSAPHPDLLAMLLLENESIQYEPRSSRTESSPQVTVLHAGCFPQSTRAVLEKHVL
jgi:hypothetical protein